MNKGDKITVAVKTDFGEQIVNFEVFAILDNAPGGRIAFISPNNTIVVGEKINRCWRLSEPVNLPHVYINPDKVHRHIENNDCIVDVQ